MEWTINGESLAALQATGLVSARVVFRSRAPDELTLEWGGLADSALPSGYAIDAEVTVAADAAIVFVGRVVAQPRHAAGSEARIVTCRGAWWWLENTVYQQQYRFSLLHDYRLRPGYRLFCDRDGNRITTSAQIADIISYAISAGAEIQLGNNPAGPTPAPTFAANRTCAEAIERCLRWTPDACTWCDYTTSPPTMHIVPWSVAVGSPASIAMTDSALRSLEVVPRPDLQVTGVRLLFENPAGAVSSEPYPTEQVFPVGFTGNEPRAVNMVIDLRGQVMIPAGLAERYYVALSSLQHSGSLVLQAAEPALAWRPGLALRITGGAAEWASMRAQVQQVSHDLASGQTTLDFGPPDHLALGDLVELLLADSREGIPYELSTGRPAAIADGVTGPPFTIIDATDEDGPKIAVVAGVINNLVPTLYGTALTATPRPTTGVLTNGTWSVYQEVHTDSSGFGTSAYIYGALTGVPADTATSGRRLFGEVVVAGGEITEIRQLRTGSCHHARCGIAAPYRHDWGS